MAINKISAKDFYDEDLFKATDELLKKMNLLEKSAKDLAKVKPLSKTTGEELKKNNAQFKELNTLEKERLKLEKQLSTTVSKNIALQEKNTKKVFEAKQTQKELTKELRDSVRAERALTQAQQRGIKSIQDLTRVNNALNLKRRQLDITTKKGRQEFDKLTVSISKNEARLKAYDKQIGRSQRNVGNYKSALGGLKNAFAGLAGGLGVAGGIALVGSVLKNGIKIFKNYSKEVSKLKAISGATDKEMEKLTKQAKALGASTAFSASQIILLDQELAKLGFTASEIEGSVEGIQSLASATGFDLAESAALAGASLRIFNLDASEAGRVADVLALSTTKSALDMSKLSTALPIVGTTASQAGQSIEKTVAQLGVLADRGIDASTAATGLRKVFSTLAKEGLTWEQAQEKLLNSTNKIKTATELFGERAATTALILAENQTSLDGLTTSLNDAEGAAKDMSDVMLDNLAGDITLAESAWEGLILSLEDGEGVFSKISRKVVQFGTDMLSTLGNMNKVFGDAFRILAGETTIIDVRLEKLKEVNEFSKKVNADLIKNQKVINNLNKEDAESVENFRKARLNYLDNEYSIIDAKLTSTELTKDETVELLYQRDLILAQVNNIKNIQPEKEKVLETEKEITGELNKQDEINKEREIENKRLAKLDKERRDRQREQAEFEFNRKIQEFAELQELQKANYEFDVEQQKAVGITKKELAIKEKEFKIAQTQELLQFIIDSGQDVTEAEKRNLRTTILALENELNNLTAGKKTNFFAKLFKGEDTESQTGVDKLLQDLGLSNEDLEKIFQQSAVLLNQFQGMLDAQFAARKQNIDNQIAESQRLQDQTQNALDEEIRHINALEEAGVAFDTKEKARLERKLKEEEKREQQALESKKKLAKQQKAIAITQATIGTAVGVVGALGNKPWTPANFILAALVAAAGAVEIATISKQKFAKGGTWVEGGKLHSEGGNLHQGNKEFERGERVSVFSRKATKNHDKLIQDFTYAINNDSVPEMLYQDATSKKTDFEIMNNFINFDKIQHSKLDTQTDLLSEISNKLSVNYNANGQVIKSGNYTYSYE